MTAIKGSSSDTKTYMKKAAFVFLCVALCGGLISCGGAERAKVPSFSSTRFLMDTVVTIRLQVIPGHQAGRLGAADQEDQPVAPPSQEELEQLVLAAFNRMEEIAVKTNRHDPAQGSDLQRLAAQAGDGRWLEVSRDTLTIQEEVERLEQEAAAVLPAATRLVDTSLGKLIDLWMTVRETKVLPRQEEIEAALALSGMEYIERDWAGDKMRLTLAGVGLDYGAVAKGYAVEEAGRILAQAGPAVYGIIDAGGNIKTIGQKPDGSLWQIGLTDPLKTKELLASIELTPGQVAATSGDYQRYEDIEGRRYHHILSPVEGWPVWYSHSVTAISSDGLKADYYSTLLFLLPVQDALELAESIPDLEAIWVTTSGELFATSGIEDHIKWQDKSGYKLRD